MSSRQPSIPGRKAQNGAIAVVFVLLATALIAFVGLAMDIGRLYVSKAELQNAADACALAAAGALTGVNANQLTAAENYGIATGRRNLVGMQAVPATVSLNADVTFSDVLNGTYLTATAAAGNALSMRYVRCLLTETNIPTILLKVANLMPGQTIGLSTVQAVAVASLEPSVSACALPLAVCKKPGSSAPDWGYVPGEWLIGRFDTQNNINGKFKWVDFPGMNQTKDLKDLINGAGQCDLSNVNNLTPTQGAVNALTPAWNWRFGVTKNSGPPADALGPDWTGYAYELSNWPSSFNAHPDFEARRLGFAPWNGVPSLSGGWSASSMAVHQAGGSRRMVVGPFVDCSTWGPGANNSQPILGWACYLMLNPVANPTNDDMALEYRGNAASSNSGCTTSGQPGGPTAGGPKVPTLVM